MTAILAFQAPTFRSVNPNGTVFDYQAMEARTRLLSSLVDSVIYHRNTIRGFASHRDAVVVTVCQEFSRFQRMDGRRHRVDTSALQRGRGPEGLQLICNSSGSNEHRKAEEQRG